MKYHRFENVRIVRKASTQKPSFAVLANEEPSGANRQVLLMVGRQGRDKIALVHGDDSTVANVVGSVMLRTQGGELVGIFGFASDASAQQVKRRYQSGELVPNLVSNPIAAVEVPKRQSFNGCDGPAMVVTQWEALQVVLT
jgi:hypothetical protein